MALSWPPRVFHDFDSLKEPWPAILWDVSPTGLVKYFFLMIRLRIWDLGRIHKGVCDHVIWHHVTSESPWHPHDIIGHVSPPRLVKAASASFRHCKATISISLVNSLGALNLQQENKNVWCYLQPSVTEHFLLIIFIFAQGFSWSPLPQPKVATLMVGISGSVTVGCGRVGVWAGVINASHILNPASQAVPRPPAYI